MRLKVSRSRLTIGDILQAEAGFKSTAEMVEFLTRFVTDADGEFLPPEQARAELLKLTLDQLPNITEQLAEGIKALTAQAVPLPTNGS